ncbi:MAG: TlpA family protein disulfide reductase [Chloroflexia bacterium]
MSNTAYHRTRRVPRDSYQEAPVQDEEAYLEDEGYDDYEEYDESEERAGLFSSPARTVALVASFVVLLVVAVSIAWLLGQRAKSSSSNLAATNVVEVPLAAAGEAPKVGALAPDFELANVSNNTPLKLSSLRGKPTLVNFWGTWCPPCRAEMPELEKLYQTYKDKVNFIGVSMGPRDEPAGVDQFVKLNKYSWTFIHDADSSVSINYQVSGIPSTFFIDKSGVIRQIHVGGADAPTLENGLKTAEQAQ